MENSIVNEVLSALEAVKDYGQPGFWILVSILIVLVLVIAALVYQRIVIKRSQAPSKATQENFETVAADLRKRALEVKKQDEGLRKRELEAKERKQQQVLKRSQRALKGSVSHIIAVGLKDLQRKPEDGGVNKSDSPAASPRPGGAVYREIESRPWEMGSGPPGDIRTRTHKNVRQPLPRACALF